MGLVSFRTIVIESGQQRLLPWVDATWQAAGDSGARRDRPIDDNRRTRSRAHAPPRRHDAARAHAGAYVAGSLLGRTEPHHLCRLVCGDAPERDARVARVGCRGAALRHRCGGPVAGVARGPAPPGAAAVGRRPALCVPVGHPVRAGGGLRPADHLGPARGRHYAGDDAGLRWCHRLAGLARAPGCAALVRVCRHRRRPDVPGGHGGGRGRRRASARHRCPVPCRGDVGGLHLAVSTQQPDAGPVRRIDLLLVGAAVPARLYPGRPEPPGPGIDRRNRAAGDLSGAADERCGDRRLQPFRRVAGAVDVHRDHCADSGRGGAGRHPGTG